MKFVAPLVPAPGLRVQVHCRTPAARHGYQVTTDADCALYRLLGIAGPFSNTNARDPAAPADVDDDMPCENGNTGRGSQRVGRHVLPGVDNRDDSGAALREINCGLIRRVVVRKHNDTPARRNRVAMQVGRNRRGHHDAGAIVVAKDQWSFESALGKNNLFRTHAPHALPNTRSFGLTQVIRAALNDSKKVVIVVAEYGTARQHRDIVHAIERCRGFVHPDACRLAVEKIITAKQAATRLVLLVRNHNSRARAGCSQCRHQACGSCAGNQYIAVRVSMFVGIGIGRGRRFAKSGRPTNQLLVEMPKRLGPHEGFVVKPGTEYAAEDVVYRRDIEVDAWPTFRRTGDQTIVQFHLRCPKIGQRRSAFADLHDRVWLFGAATDNAPGAMQLEAAANHRDAVRKQSRRQSIAGKALQLSAIEPKA